MNVGHWSSVSRTSPLSKACRILVLTGCLIPQARTEIQRDELTPTLPHDRQRARGRGNLPPRHIPVTSPDPTELQPPAQSRAPGNVATDAGSSHISSIKTQLYVKCGVALLRRGQEVSHRSLSSAGPLASEFLWETFPQNSYSLSALPAHPQTDCCCEVGAWHLTFHSKRSK